MSFDHFVCYNTYNFKKEGRIMKQIIKLAFIKSLTVMAGYLVLGIGFGIIAKKNGYGILWLALLVELLFTWF